MEMIRNLNLIDSIGFTAITLVCSYLITAATKLLTPIYSKYLPFISMIIGILVGLTIAIMLHEDVGKACLVGLLIGGFTSGLYTGVKGAAGGYDTSKSSVNNTTSISKEPVKIPTPTYTDNIRRND